MGLKARCNLLKVLINIIMIVFHHEGYLFGKVNKKIKKLPCSYISATLPQGHMRTISHFKRSTVFERAILLI